MAEKRDQRWRFLEILGVCLALASVSSPGANAQNWEFSSGDDGSFFVGYVRWIAGRGVTLICGERSPQGMSPYTTGNLEPDITPPGILRLNIDASLLAPPQRYDARRSDVLIGAGASGFRLPPLQWNELFNVWETDLGAADPFFAALTAAPSIDLYTDAGKIALGAAGFAGAYQQLDGYCRSMFAQIGKPWGAAAAVAPPSGAMKQAAEASIQQGCNGPAQREAGYLLTGDIDGDGQEDAVVDWARLRCQTGIARPFCGAALCSVDIFLTRAFPSRGMAETILAIGARLVPLDNGNDGLITGGSLSNCQFPPRNPCEFLHYWNGSALVAAP